MTIRLAFAGAGFIANYHARAARRIPGVELAAVVNLYDEPMTEFAARYGIPRTYHKLDDLLADGGVDAISINTPNALHAPQAIAALQAGLHVLVEKPMAMNAAEAGAMLAASRQAGKTLMVGHCWRFDPEVRWLKAQVDAGKLGKIIRTKGYGVHANWGPAGWFTQKPLAGGGALADMGIHALDTARFLLGDPLPVSVYARIGTHYGTYDVDDTGLLLVSWDNGATSYIESGWWQPQMDGPEACTQLYGQSGFGRLFPTRLDLPRPAESRVETLDGGFTHPRPDHCPQSMYDDQMAYFIECVHQSVTPVPGGREGWINMQIVDAAYESARSGQAVHINVSEENV